MSVSRVEAAQPSDVSERARIEGGLELVEAIARQVVKAAARSVALDELIAAGREGLVTAARRFDPERGIPFNGYASFRIRGAMLDAARRQGQLPRRIQASLRAMEAGSLYSEEAAGESAPPAAGQTQEDAARALDEHLAGMATAMALGMVGAPAVDDQNEVIAREVQASPEEQCEQAELATLLTAEIDELPHAEAELVRRHYFSGERFDHVAKDLGLSKSWASRLHARAIERLTKKLKMKI